MSPIEHVSRETQDRLDLYVSLLRQWNSRIRLTGLDWNKQGSDPIGDSLRLWRLVSNSPTSALDIGSGNGLPALPLCIAFGIPYTLAESDRRKAAFLREAARVTGCPAEVVASRVEDMPILTYDLITARAFGPLDKLLGLVWRRQNSRTLCLFPKGQQARAEIEAASHHWMFKWEDHPELHGRVIAIRHVEPRK